MAFVLTLFGLLLIVTGARGTVTQFGAQVAQDVTGGFVYYVAAIAGIGALGYVDALRTISRLFMALILIVLVLANRGFFAQFSAALKTGAIAPQAPAAAGNSSSSEAAGVVSSQSGAFGQPPESSGQAKFNGWLNYLFK